MEIQNDCKDGNCNIVISDNLKLEAFRLAVKFNDNLEIVENNKEDAFVVACMSGKNEMKYKVIPFSKITTQPLLEILNSLKGEFDV